MSQDYTVAKELASLKEIKQSAEQRISDLSLNALNYVNDHRLHKTGGGGTGGGALIVTVNNDTGALDKTWQEIHDAALTSPVLLVDVNGDIVQIAYFDGTGIGEAGYAVTFVSLGTGAKLNAAASTKTSYPVMQI